MALKLFPFAYVNLVFPGRSCKLFRCVFVNSCDDHAIALSEVSALPWEWGTSLGTARFVWSCAYKYLYGQTESAAGMCTGNHDYQLDISITDTSLEFMDDYCGALTVADTLGTSKTLYVYIGADDDTGAAKWDSIQIWGHPSWDISATRSPTAMPSIEPTVNLGDADIVDEFDKFEEGIWSTQCSGCTYESGSLMVAGDSQMMRTIGTVANNGASLRHLRGHLVKASSCDDQLVAVSTSSALAWSWGVATGTARFAWK